MERPAKSRSDRHERLQRAGYNVLNLAPADVDLDLLSDVPARSPIERVRGAWLEVEAGAEEPGEVDVEGRAESLYGPAYYVAAMKGRSAEAILASLACRPGMTVLTHGLFKTTERALLQNGVKIEVAPGQRAGDSSDVDLDWVDKRLSLGAAGVYLEASNNALGGRPLRLENLEAVAGSCRRRGALLFLDATRLLSNCVVLDGDSIDLARKFTELADAFTVSCPKELLVPYGALLAVRSRELKQRAFLSAFQAGALLEPAAARAGVAAGIDYVRDNPGVLRTRWDQVQTLADTLVQHSVPCLRPPGGHAAYVPFTSLLTPGDALAARGLECLLYLESGVRAYIWQFSALPGTMRLTVPLARYSNAQLAAVAPALRRLFDGAGVAPSLREDPEERSLGLFARFALAGRVPDGAA